jgi:hypothetical protein
MKLTRWITTGMAAFTLLLASPVKGQIGKVHGTALEGQETLPGYSIRLRANGAEIRRSMTTPQGKYEFALLAPGDYEVEIEENAVFYRQRFTLGPNETRPLTIDIATATATASSACQAEPLRTMPMAVCRSLSLTPYSPKS